MEDITTIFVSKKLESVLPAGFIQKDSALGDNLLGKWNATLFYISRKKCLLITNSITRYTVILPGVGTSEFKEISTIFAGTFAKQLERDGILVEASVIANLVGKLSFFKTDNDKRTTGVQNYILTYFEVWKDDFGDYANWDFLEIGRRLNGIPYELFVTPSGSVERGWSTPKKKMDKVISGIVEGL